MALPLSLTHEEEDKYGADRYDSKHNHGSGGGAGIQIASAEGLFPDENVGCRRGVIRSAVQIQFGNIVHIETADHTRNECVDKYGTEVGKGDAEENLRVGGAVNFGSLEYLGIDAQDTGDEDNHRIAVPLPELDECDYILGAGLINREVMCFLKRGLDNLPASYADTFGEKVVNRSSRVAEELCEKNCHGSRGDNIGHIEYYFKEALTADLVAAAGEPCGQQQRKRNLGDEVHSPDF